MTLAADEFIRRFLLHVLPAGFHRIRHYGLFANSSRAENLARARLVLGQPPPQDQIEVVAETDQPTPLAQPCPCCGGPMIVIETFEPGHPPSRHPPCAPPADKAASPPPTPLRLGRFGLSCVIRSALEESLPGAAVDIDVAKALVTVAGDQAKAEEAIRTAGYGPEPVAP